VLLEEIEYKIFCDLDGVLSDFSKGVKELLKLEHSEDKYESTPQYRKKMWNALADYQKAGGKFWYELKLMPDGMELWDYIKKYPNTEILSATGNSKFGGASQKKKWVKKNLGNPKVNLVQKAEQKAKFAAPNHILIDDKEKAINPWIESGGIGILHTNTKNTIRQLKKLGL
jgi:hypothetical protein